MTRVLLLRLGLLLAVILLALLGWRQVRDDVGMTFVYFIALGTAGGFLAVKYFIPWLGDAVGTALFSSGEQVGDDPALKAAAKLAQGDYEGAIAEHEKNFAQDPTQSQNLAVSSTTFGLPLDTQRPRRYEVGLRFEF